MRTKHSIIYILLLIFSLLTITNLSSLRSTKQINTSFESFTDTLFRQELSSNTLNLHYTLKDPNTFHISNDTISLGTYETDSVNTSAATENCLAALKEFPYAKLSEKNQLTYDILYSYLEMSLAGAPYTLYEEPLSPLTGTQAQFPILLSEYPFYKEDDVITYLALLENVPEYFESLIAFEQAKSDAGLFMPSYSAEAVIEECESFLTLGSSNYLYSSFQNRLNNLSNLDSSQKEAYISKNQNLIDTCILPSYETLADAISNLKDTGKNSGNLCNYPDGLSYYECLVQQQTGSNRTITELKTLILSQIKDDLAILQTHTSSEQIKGISSFSLKDPNPIAILSQLKEKMKDTFPEPPNVNIEIKYVPQEMAEYLSPAFYMIPAIDNIETNVIYINQGHLPDDLDLFTTLAHEGYPGHLYQTTYFGSTEQPPIRSLLNFGGYSEGWALYTEYISYYFTDLPKEQAAILQHNDSIILGLYALADIGIHYDGWTLLDTVSFFHGYGITNTDTIKNIYELIIGDPANYLKYYIGYVEFLELKKFAMEEWGDSFTQKAFHKAVLDIGPAPFDILRKHLQKPPLTTLS